MSLCNPNYSSVGTRMAGYAHTEGITSTHQVPFVASSKVMNPGWPRSPPTLHIYTQFPSGNEDLMKAEGREGEWEGDHIDGQFLIVDEPKIMVTNLD